MLGISWKEQRINISILELRDWSGKGVNGKVARMKLQYFGHVLESAGNLALTVLEGSVDGLRRPKRQWMDDIEEWSGCSYIQLKMSQQGSVEKKDNRVVICSRQPSSTNDDDGRLVSE